MPFMSDVHAEFWLVPVLSQTACWIKMTARLSRVFLAPSFGACRFSIMLLSGWERRGESALYCFWICKPARKTNITAFQICMRNHSFTAESQPHGTKGWEHPAVTQLGEAGAACPWAMVRGCCCPGLCQQLWGISSRHVSPRRAELFVCTSVPALGRTLPLLGLAPEQTVKPEAGGF